MNSVLPLVNYEELRSGVVIVHVDALRDQRRPPLWRVLSIHEVPHRPTDFAIVTLRNIWKQETKDVQFYLLRRCMTLLRDRETISKMMSRIERRTDDESLADMHALRLCLPSHGDEAEAARERIEKKLRKRAADAFWQGSDKRPRS